MQFWWRFHLNILSFTLWHWDCHYRALGVSIDLVGAWFHGWIWGWQVLLEKQVCFSVDGPEFPPALYQASLASSHIIYGRGPKCSAACIASNPWWHNLWNVQSSSSWCSRLRQVSSSQSSLSLTNCLRIFFVALPWRSERYLPRLFCPHHLLHAYRFVRTRG